MNSNKSLHEQRKRLNKIYNVIIKQKELPEYEFDKLMQLWIQENEKLEAKEIVFEMNFSQHHTMQNAMQIGA